MLSVLNVIIYALIVLISVVLIVLILLQPSKGGGLGSTFGGVGENVFGAHAVEHLSKVTVWLVSIFFVLTLVLTILSAHSKEDESVMTKDGAVKEEVQKVEGESAATTGNPAAQTKPAQVDAVQKDGAKTDVKADDKKQEPKK